MMVIGVDEVFFEASLTMKQKPSLFGKLTRSLIRLSHSDNLLTDGFTNGIMCCNNNVSNVQKRVLIRGNTDYNISVNIYLLNDHATLIGEPFNM